MHSRSQFASGCGNFSNGNINPIVEVAQERGLQKIDRIQCRKNFYFPGKKSEKIQDRFRLLMLIVNNDGTSSTGLKGRPLILHFVLNLTLSTLLVVALITCTVWRHVDIAILSNRGFMSITWINHTYQENLSCINILFIKSMKSRWMDPSFSTKLISFFRLLFFSSFFNVTRSIEEKLRLAATVVTKKKLIKSLNIFYIQM